jgi:uncharacterized membrane protein
LVLSFINNGGNSIENLKFNLNLDNRESEINAIESALRDYNKISASFYNSAGHTGGLKEMPSAPLVKRRLFKDINMLKRDGLVMVFDKNGSGIKNINFLNRELVMAETDEVWAVALQDVNTRKSIFGTKAVEVKVRYVLHKERFYNQGKKWIVYEADVYPKNESIPDLNIKSSLL